VTFNYEMTLVISRMWKPEHVRRFRKPFSNPANFVGEPPRIEAHDSSVFYVTNLLLITWIKWIRKLICMFNVCFSVYRENTKKMLICTERCILGVFAHFENSGSQPWFSVVKITPVIFSKWISKLYEDFENRFESRQVLSATTTHGGATTTRGGKNNSNFHFIFPF
jgi:hypothetical protein